MSSLKTIIVEQKPISLSVDKGKNKMIESSPPIFTHLEEDSTAFPRRRTKQSLPPITRPKVESIASSSKLVEPTQTKPQGHPSTQKGVSA